MTARFARSVAGLILCAGAVYAASSTLPAQSQNQPAPVVYSAEVDSVIHPVSAEYMIQTLAAADHARATLVVFTLRTPGGLVDSTRDIVSHIIAAATPVAIFIGPSGSRAASAGFLLTISADVAAMAPGTHIGAAHPVAGGGEQMDATMAKKSEEDLAAYARTLASARHRNVDLAVDAVRNSRAFTETEAAAATPPLIDTIAADVPELLKQIDGRTIRRFDGTTVVLRTAGARVVSSTMSLRQRVLSAIAHPNVAYLLLSLGMLGLTIELWSPGAILPGIVGGVSLLLAFFALQLLPVNFAGLLLILLGLLLFALEIKVTSYGLLTAGGLVSLVLGSMILMDSGGPELAVSFRLILAVVLGFGGIGIVLARLALASQRRPPVTGTGGLLGHTAQAMTALEPGTVGKVFTRGEIWQAITDAAIPQGATVRIIDIDGLTLTVRRD
ncbi:MAG: NfeD family protein [Vicinamibacterales bacterium]